FGSARSLQIS
ncbi:hypothetical protein CLOP_g12187, partial [Closterium sp. NIES-67]